MKKILKVTQQKVRINKKKNKRQPKPMLTGSHGA